MHLPSFPTCLIYYHGHIYLISQLIYFPSNEHLKILVKIYGPYIMGRPAFCMCENKGADQLRGKRAADHHLCFRYIESTIPKLPRSKTVCTSWFVLDLVKTLKTGLLMMRGICHGKTILLLSRSITIFIVW